MKRLPILLLCLLAAATLLLAACSKEAPVAEIKYDSKRSTDDGMQHYTFLVHPLYNPQLLHQKYQPVMEFVWADMMNNRLSGAPDSSARRAILGAKLGIGYANGKTFLQRLNHYGVTRDEFIAAIAEMDEGAVE